MDIVFGAQLSVAGNQAAKTHAIHAHLTTAWILNAPAQIIFRLIVPWLQINNKFSSITVKIVAKNVTHIL